MKKSMLTQTLGALLLLLITTSLAQAAPQLVVRPGSLSATADYGTNPSTQSLTVANGQDGDLNYDINTNYITPSTGWLGLSQNSGQLTGNTTDTIIVSYDLRPGGVFIGVGTHQADLEVTSNGGDRTVNVTLTVLDQATLDVTPTTLTVMTYEGYSTTSQVTITNTGESALHYTATTSGTYAYASPTTGTVPGNGSYDLDVVFNDPPFLPPGIYSSGTLTISDPYSMPTTKTVDLVLEVRPDVSTLQVYIKPTAAANAGAQWRRVGTVTWHDSGQIEPDVPSGPQTIEFRDITGWQTSKNITLGVRGRDIHETVTGTYFINQYTVSYGAQANGYISGITPQTVEHGSDSTPVKAIGFLGYGFVEWSDGYTSNPRQDVNVTTDTAVSASFAPLDYFDSYTFVYNNRTSTMLPQFMQNGIYIPPFEGPGFFKIIRKPGAASYPDIPALYCDDSLEQLYTQARIGEVYVAGDLKKVNAVGVPVDNLYAENLSRVSMLATTSTATSDGLNEFLTSLWSGQTINIITDNFGQPDAQMLLTSQSGTLDTDLFPVQVSLVGVGLHKFSAPEQIATVNMSSKKYRWNDGLGNTYLDLSLSRIPSTMESSVDAGFLNRLVSIGGGSEFVFGSPVPAIGAPWVRSLANIPSKASTDIRTRGVNALIGEYSAADMVSALSLAPQIMAFRGDIGITSMTCASNYASIVTRYGDIKADSILTSGALNALVAWDGVVEVGTVKTGDNQSFLNPHILKIIGEYGVDGYFAAGVDAFGAPDYRGDIGLIYADPTQTPGTISGEVHINDSTVQLYGDTQAVVEGRLLVNP